jgi:trimeric autotransporter adhesin
MVDAGRDGGSAFVRDSGVRDAGPRDAGGLRDSGVIVVPDLPDAGVDAGQPDAGPRFFFDAGPRVSYLKSQVTYPEKRFGWSVAMDGDGSTLAVGALFDHSGSRQVDGNQFNQSAYASGAIFVFERTGLTWRQAAYLKTSNADLGDWFGFSVAISEDGDTIVGGAPFEASRSTGVNGQSSDNSVVRAGAAYVFQRDGGSWTQTAYLKPQFSPSDFDTFGWSVAISADGRIIVVGTPAEDSSGVGFNGVVDEAAVQGGAVSVFVMDAGQWVPGGTLRPEQRRGGAQFGTAMAVNTDGTRLVVGAPEENGLPQYADGGEDPAGFGWGAGYVFDRADAGWAQVARLTPAVPGLGDRFGFSVAIDGRGDLVAVGAPLERSASSGVDGNAADDSLLSAGAVYLFAPTPAWSQQHYVKATPTASEAQFGHRVCLRADGTALVVGAPANTAQPGAVFSFLRTMSGWSQPHTPTFAPFGEATDRFGWSLGCSSNTGWFSAGAIDEASSASGVNGEVTNNDAVRAGAVYVFAP